jgi:DNA-binding transcriptional LysR family regulator
MDLEQLRTFVAVADCGSFAGAASRLGHPKSTVAKRIGQLERSLGITLLERGQRTMRLTSEGNDMLNPARELLSSAEEVREAARTKGERIAGSIRISVPTLLGQTILPSALGRFADQHPAVNLSVVAEDRYVDVVADGYDFAIRIGPGTDSSLIRRKLSQSTLILVASKSYAHAGIIEHPEAIEQLETIGFVTGAAPETWALSGGLTKVEVRPAPRLSFRNLPAIVALLDTYAAVALLPTFLVGQKVRVGELIRVCPDWRGDCHEISLVYSKKERMPLRVRALIEHLASDFGDLDLSLSSGGDEPPKPTSEPR